MQIQKSAVKAYLTDLQSHICDSLTEIDGELFAEDSWQREPGERLGGGGIGRVLEGGKVIEKGGINFSHVVGSNMPASATAHRPELAGRSFEAMGVSLVIHPRNPYAPTSHMNVRFFIAEKEGEDPIWWFGGGYDLTPYYGFDEDCSHWHQTAADACAPFGEEVYPELKKWCDEYFYLKHRDEPRGIGGVFFDDLNQSRDVKWGFDTSFKFMQAIGNSFIDAYCPILAKRKDAEYGERQRKFQCYRRGRYVEFNLVFDRGTLFGLQTGGRTESILMSMPPVVEWVYNWEPEVGTDEKLLYDKFLVCRDWLSEI